MKPEFQKSLFPLMIGLPGTALSEDDLSRLKRIRPASVILFSRNFSSVKQIKSLIAEIKSAVPGTLLAVDHEGGRVNRFPDYLPPFPAPRLFGEAKDAGKMFEAAKTAASALLGWGFDINLAPVVDLLTPTSHQRMIDRCFGNEPGIVSKMAEAFIKGMHAGGLICAAKHFPGTGPAELDPHETDPVVKIGRQELESHLIPFRAAIKAGVDCVMISHIRYTEIDPDWPATLSEKIIKGILKEELGFSGTILSDDLEMGAIQNLYQMEMAVRRAKESGCDILLSCKETCLQLRAYETLSR